MKILSTLSILFAFVAAGLWGWSAFVKVPIIKSGFGTLVTVMSDGSSVIGEGPFFEALAKISRLNAFAALCAFLSTLLQAVTLLKDR